MADTDNPKLILLGWITAGLPTAFAIGALINLSALIVSMAIWFLIALRLMYLAYPEK